MIEGGDLRRCQVFCGGWFCFGEEGNGLILVCGKGTFIPTSKPL